MDITNDELVLLERILKGVQAPLISPETNVLRSLYFKVIKELEGLKDDDNLYKEGKVE